MEDIHEVTPATAPVSAVEFFKTIGQTEKLVTLRNGMGFLIRKVKVKEVMSEGQISLPAITTAESVKDLSPEDQEKFKAESLHRMNRVIIAAVVSPKLVEGTVSNADDNIIALDDPAFPDALKTELMGHVFEFNGYTESARKFFRILSPG